MSATSASATSALGPCPAPRNLTTKLPSASVSTTAGNEPPSRSGTTYRDPTTRGKAALAMLTRL